MANPSAPSRSHRCRLRGGTAPTRPPPVARRRCARTRRVLPLRFALQTVLLPGFPRQPRRIGLSAALRAACGTARSLRCSILEKSLKQCLDTYIQREPRPLAMRHAEAAEAEDPHHVVGAKPEARRQRLLILRKRSIAVRTSWMSAVTSDLPTR